MVPPTSCKVPRVSQYSGFCLLARVFGYGAFTLSGRLSQNRSPDLRFAYDSPLPRGQARGLGSSDFARRYSRNRSFFLFLRLLRCFSSAGSLCMPMYSPCSDGGSLRRVSPFRNPWITGYLLLPTAYRSLSRLSSALSAQASTLCSLSLDLGSHTLSSILPCCFPCSVTVRSLSFLKHSLLRFGSMKLIRFLSFLDVFFSSSICSFHGASDLLQGHPLPQFPAIPSHLLKSEFAAAACSPMPSPA